MKTYLDNLRPFERRVVVVVGAMLFVVLNLWFVIPHFSDWSAAQARMAEAREKLARYENEIAQTNTYARQVRALEGEGLSVPPEEQALHFGNAIQSQAGASRVQIGSTTKISERTNQFFLERSQTLTVQAREAELVDFLYNLGAGNSLIRVRDLSLRPDPPRQALQANIKLVASYQKKPAKAPAPAGKSTTTTPPAAASASTSSPKRP